MVGPAHGPAHGPRAVRQPVGVISTVRETKVLNSTIFEPDDHVSLVSEPFYSLRTMGELASDSLLSCNLHTYGPTLDYYLSAPKFEDPKNLPP